MAEQFRDLEIQLSLHTTCGDIQLHKQTTRRVEAKTSKDEQNAIALMINGVLSGCLSARLNVLMLAAVNLLEESEDSGEMLSQSHDEYTDFEDMWIYIGKRLKEDIGGEF